MSATTPSRLPVAAPIGPTSKIEATSATQTSYRGMPLVIGYPGAETARYGPHSGFPWSAAHFTRPVAPPPSLSRIRTAITARDQSAGRFSGPHPAAH